jgi:hypothetical protein
MSRGVISTARPGLIGRLLRIDDWRSIELWADVLVIDRGVSRETVALDKVVDWMIASRLFWSELRLRLDDGRQGSLRGAPRRWAFGGALEGALLGVRHRRRAQAIMERRNDILALSQSLGEALSLCHSEAQHLLAATAFMAKLDVLDVERVIGSLEAPLQERCVRSWPFARSARRRELQPMSASLPMPRTATVISSIGSNRAL